MEITDVRIRPMREEDLPAVLRIERENFSLPWSERNFLDALDLEYYHFLTAYCGEKIAGYCGYIRSFETADVTKVAVEGDCRRRGIGERLLRQLMEDGYQSGVERFSLDVRASNHPAIALYKKMGFFQEGLRKGYYEDPREDALIMWTQDRRSAQDADA